MAVEDSRLKGFHHLSVSERLNLIKMAAGLSDEAANALGSFAELDCEAADRMVENVIGTMSLPIGIATNFVIDSKHYLIPLCIEESSVVAAASNMAKRCLKNGGFFTECDPPLMIAQIQVLDIENIAAAEEALAEARDSLITQCNDVDSTMIRLGGGCKSILTRVIESQIGTMLVVHLIVDCQDAMGANAVNTMAERISPRIAELTKGRVNLRILSNLAVHRIARASAIFTPEEIDNSGDREKGLAIIASVLEAYHFAAADPFRATTHNKGLMNAISGIALACGQDWRAVEAGCHAWASHGRAHYSSLTEWWQDDEGNLCGRIEVPLAVGIIGGASKIHPGARANLELLGVESAQELAGVMAAAGLAQNLGAMKALSTDGIQAGHMRMHMRNMASSEGADSVEIEKIAVLLEDSSETITPQLIRTTLKHLRDDHSSCNNNVD